MRLSGLLILILEFVKENHGQNSSVSREGRFLSSLTNLMDSLLPSFNRKLPEPQLFVDLRRINKKEPPENPRNKKIRSDAEQKSETSSLQKRIFLPTRTPPIYEENVIKKYKSTKPPTYPPIKEILKKTKVPTDKLKLYMNSLRDKLKTIYKDDKYRKTTKTDQESFGGNTQNIHRNLLKRRLNLDPVMDRTELLVSNRRTDLDKYEAVEDVDNDIQYDDDLETLRDQIAQESIESGSAYKPLSKILAKTDDVIYKQMNFWRNQFESRRLLDFLSPANDSVDNKQEDVRPRIETELIIGTPKLENKKRKVFKKFKDKDVSVSDLYKTASKPSKYTFKKSFNKDGAKFNKANVKSQSAQFSSDWEPEDVEKVITEELREIQETLMAEDWTPLREVPKIMSSSDTPNIYQLRTNEMQDIMTPVENKISVRSRPRVQHDYPTMVSMELQRTSTEDSEEDSSKVKTANTNRRLVPIKKGVDMTAAPELSETITHSRVESSLARPETKEQEEIMDSQERFFMKTGAVGTEQSTGKPYDFNVESRDIPIEEDLMLTEPEVSWDRSLLASLEHISDLRVAEEAEYDLEDDIVPLYLHVPKSRTGCPKFCITINVEVTRAGRQIRQGCRKSFICQSQR